MLKARVSSGRVTAIRLHVYEVYVELLSGLTGSTRPPLNRPCSTSRSVRSLGKYRVFQKLNGSGSLLSRDLSLIRGRKPEHRLVRKTWLIEIDTYFTPSRECWGWVNFE